MTVGDIGALIVTILLYVYQFRKPDGTAGISLGAVGLIGSIAGVTVFAALNFIFPNLLSFWSIYIFLAGGYVCGLIVSAKSKKSFTIQGPTNWKNTVVFAFSFIVLTVFIVPILFGLFAGQLFDPGLTPFYFWMSPLVLLSILGLIWYFKKNPNEL